MDTLSHGILAPVGLYKVPCSLHCPLDLTSSPTAEYTVPWNPEPLLFHHPLQSPLVDLQVPYHDIPRLSALVRSETGMTPAGHDKSSVFTNVLQSAIYRLKCEAMLHRALIPDEEMNMFESVR